MEEYLYNFTENTSEEEEEKYFRFNIELPLVLNEWCRKKAKNRGCSKARFIQDCIEMLYNNNHMTEDEADIRKQLALMSEQINELTKQLQLMGVKE